MWKKLKKAINKLPPFVRNIYFITALLFVVWMAFFDDNNIFVQYRRHKELHDLTRKKQFYLDQIAVTDKEYRELTTDPNGAEKYAREHYWMKRDNEDVFVIVKDNK